MTPDGPSAYASSSSSAADRLDTYEKGKPVSRESTMPSGNVSRNWAQGTTGADSSVRRAPTISPTIALPPICCQRDSVVRSYMTRSSSRSRPEVPNSRT